MRKAIINGGGLVTNVVELPDDWTGAAGQWQIPAGHSAIDAGNGSPGDSWNGSVFVKSGVVHPVIIPYATFVSRFTATEFDACTDFIEEIDLVTGKPKRRALKQGMARVYALGSVNLLDPRTDQFLSALVAGGIISSQRKTGIITP